MVSQSSAFWQLATVIQANLEVVYVSNANTKLKLASFLCMLSLTCKSLHFCKDSVTVSPKISAHLVQTMWFQFHFLKQHVE